MGVRVLVIAGPAHAGMEPKGLPYSHRVEERPDGTKLSERKGLTIPRPMPSTNKQPRAREDIQDLSRHVVERGNVPQHNTEKVQSHMDWPAAPQHETDPEPQSKDRRAVPKLHLYGDGSATDFEHSGCKKTSAAITS
jgi:hypothetical protein